MIDSFVPQDLSYLEVQLSPNRRFPNILWFLHIYHNQFLKVTFVLSWIRFNYSSIELYLTFLEQLIRALFHYKVQPDPILII